MADRPRIRSVGSLLGCLQAGTLLGTVQVGSSRSNIATADQEAYLVQVGSSRSNIATANWAAYRWLIERANGRLTAEVLTDWINQVIHAAGISYVRVLSLDLADFRRHLETAKPRYGPDANRQILWWDGEPIELKSKKDWEFLSAVWGRYNVPFADIAKQVWGDDMTKPGTIRQRVYRVNKALTEAHINLAFSSEGEAISPIGDWPSSYGFRNRT